MNSKADHSPSKRHLRIRRLGIWLLIAVRHASVWGLRLAAVGTLCLLLAFAYLHLVGLPAYVTDVFLDRMAQRGYVLQIKRLRLELDRGLVASDVRMFASAHAAEPSDRSAGSPPASTTSTIPTRLPTSSNCPGTPRPPRRSSPTSIRPTPPTSTPSSAAPPSSPP